MQVGMLGILTGRGDKIMPITSRARDFSTKAFITITCVALASLPLDFYLLLKYSLEPQGFLQNLLVVGIGVYFLGSVQVLLLFLLVIGLVALWAD